jgi:hypothetical protein
MDNGATLKVYNKKGKLNILIRDTKSIKTVSIYKYNGENVDTHSFTYAKGGFLKNWQSFYELQISEDGIVNETIVVSKEFIEQTETTGELEIIKTSINLESGNVYEKRLKYFEGEKYEASFKNNKLSEFAFKFKESKINEYIKKIKNEQKKD